MKPTNKFSILSRWLLPISSMFLGGVLLLSATAKIGDLHHFIAYVTGIRYITPPLAALIVILVPSLELAVGVMYLKISTRPHVQIVGILLFAGFLFFQCAAAIPILHLTETPCGCFGKLFPETGALTTIARGSIFLSLASFNLLISRSAENVVPNHP